MMVRAMVVTGGKGGGTGSGNDTLGKGGGNDTGSNIRVVVMPQ